MGRIRRERSVETLQRTAGGSVARAPVVAVGPRGVARLQGGLEMSQTPGEEPPSQPRRAGAGRNWWWFLLIAVFLAVFVYYGLQARG